MKAKEEAKSVRTTFKFEWFLYDYFLKHLTSSPACAIFTLTSLLWVFCQETQKKRRKEGKPRFVFVLNSMTLFSRSCHLNDIGCSLLVFDLYSVAFVKFQQNFKKVFSIMHEAHLTQKSLLYQAAFPNAANLHEHQRNLCGKLFWILAVKFHRALSQSRYQVSVFLVFVILVVFLTSQDWEK